MLGATHRVNAVNPWSVTLLLCDHRNPVSFSKPVPPPSAFCAFPTDATALDLALHVRAERGARLQRVLKMTQLQVFHRDLRLHCTWIASNALRLRASAILGRSDDELLGPESAARRTEIERRVVRTVPGERQELWGTPDNKAGRLDLIVEPRLDPEGCILGLICAATDITERMRQGSP